MQTSPKKYDQSKIDIKLQDYNKEEKLNQNMESCQDQNIGGQEPQIKKKSKSQQQLFEYQPKICITPGGKIQQTDSVIVSKAQKEIKQSVIKPATNGTQSSNGQVTEGFQISRVKVQVNQNGSQISNGQVTEGLQISRVKVQVNQDGGGKSFQSVIRELEYAPLQYANQHDHVDLMLGDVVPYY